MKTDEKGLTLIEVIAALAIISLVSGIIWSIFFQGFNYSQKSVSKNTILQETNILTSNLNQLHRTLNLYEIRSENCEIKITDLESSPQKVYVFSSDKICFKIQQMNQTAGEGPITVDPSNHNSIIDNKDVSLSIYVSDKKNSANNTTINTFLYRLKGVGY